MIKGTLNNGFEYEVDPNVINKWKFIYLSKKSDEDGTAAVELFELILGEKQLLELIEHLGGDPDTQEVTDCILEIVSNLASEPETKNL